MIMHSQAMQAHSEQSGFTVSTTKERESFSRPSHFAWALLPVALGVIFCMIDSLLKASNPHLALVFTGPMRNVIMQEQSFWFHIAVFAGFMGSLGAAIGLLHSVGKLEDQE